MTSLSNLVSNLDCKDPQIVKLFTDEYRKILITDVDDRKLNAAKILVDQYIKSQLGENIINYRIYSYKTLQGITVEILIQPENTSIIVQYLLKLTESSTKLFRIR